MAIRIPDVGKLVSRALPTLQEVAASSLRDLATISEPGAATKGAQGGVIAGSPTITTDVPCGLRALSGPVEREIAERLSISNAVTVDFEVTQAVSNLASITIVGQTYKARSTVPQGANAVLKHVVCEQVS